MIMCHQVCEDITLPRLLPLPQGTDASMLLKLTKQHGQNTHFHKPRATNSPFFGIVHFAGTVYYDTRGVCTACVVFHTPHAQ